MHTLKSVNTVPEIDPYHKDTRGLTLTCLWIDPRNRTCGISQDYNDYSQSMDEYHSLILSHNITPPDHNQAIVILTDNPLIDRVIDGWDSDWDGNNIVGHLNDDAQAAMDELLEEFDQCDTDDHEIWLCADYFYSYTYADLGVSKDSTDAQLEEAAEKLEKEAGESIVFDDDILSYLKILRDELNR